MSPDGVHVFIINQGDGNVNVIDTLLDKVIARPSLPNKAKSRHHRQPAANYAVFEPKLQRLYVANSGKNTVSVIKANGTDLANGFSQQDCGCSDFRHADFSGGLARWNTRLRGSG